MEMLKLRYIKKPLMVVLELCVSIMAFGQDEVRNFGNFYVAATGSVNITGNFYNAAGSNYENNGTVTFNANITNYQIDHSSGAGTTVWKSLSGTTSVLDGSEVFNTHDLTFDNANGFLLNSDLGVDNTATFGNGIVASSVMPHYIIFNTAGASYTGVSDASHVSGWVRKIGNVAFTFPVGDGTTYRPAGISAPATLTDAFDCKYFYTQGTNSGSVLTPVEAISPSEYWEMNRSNGSSSVVIMLSWDQTYAALPVQATNRLGLTHYNGTNWVNISDAPYNGTSDPVPNTGSLTSVSTADFGVFTFAQIMVGVLPIYSIDLSAVLTNRDDKSITNLSWTYHSSTSISKFELEKSVTGASYFQKIADISPNGLQIQFYKDALIGSQQQTVFYRIKGIDVNGAIKYSNIVNVRKRIENNFMVWPNPIQNTLQAAIHYDKSEIVTFRLTGVGGQVFLTRRIQLHHGQNFIQFEHLDGLASGNYLLQMYTADGAINTAWVIKR